MSPISDQDLLQAVRSECDGTEADCAILRGQISAAIGAGEWAARFARGQEPGAGPIYDAYAAFRRAHSRHRQTGLPEDQIAVDAARQAFVQAWQQHQRAEVVG